MQFCACSTRICETCAEDLDVRECCDCGVPLCSDGCNRDQCFKEDDGCGKVMCCECSERESGLASQNKIASCSCGDLFRCGEKKCKFELTCKRCQVGLCPECDVIDCDDGEALCWDCNGGSCESDD
jgi:hypothetical protein